VDVLGAENPPAPTRERLERDGIARALNEDMRTRHTTMVGTALRLVDR
jgi:hypothetical protein